MANDDAPDGETNWITLDRDKMLTDELLNEFKEMPIDQLRLCLQVEFYAEVQYCYTFPFCR